MSPSLFQPLQLGAVTLAHRVVMAPLTRLRATPDGDVPNDLMREYYRQRTSGGLIVSEGAQVSARGKGYMDAPGIYSPKQVAGWQRITETVHDRGGRIAAQLWHVGRVSHPSFHGGAAPVSASAEPYVNRTTIRGEDGRPTRVDCPTPRALTAEGIASTVQEYGKATICAREAGFDLVEIHGAHGYLPHQFLSEASNRREDAYGGTLRNRLRFPLEIVDAVTEAWSADRVGYRVSPFGTFNGLEERRGDEAVLHLATELTQREIAYLHLSEPDRVGGPPISDTFREALRRAFPGPIIAAGAYTLEKAERVLSAGFVDAVAFGRAFIANPDLPERLRIGAALNEARSESFYGGGAEGYTDYPTIGT